MGIALSFIFVTDFLVFEEMSRLKRRIRKCLHLLVKSTATAARRSRKISHN